MEGTSPPYGPASYFLDLSQLPPGDSVFWEEDPTFGPGWRLLSQPRQIVQATSLDEVRGVLAQVEDHVRQGGVAAGFLSYESAPALNPKIVIQEPSWPVLAWFGLYDGAGKHYRELYPVEDPTPIHALQSELDLSEYAEAFTQVKKALAEGESYQINLTFRNRFALDETAARFFASRCGVFPPRYASFIHGGDWQIASFSPELFFERDDDQIAMKPMKGTAEAPTSRKDQLQVARDLVENPKTRAENIMIVDMVRNDLGAICEVGSVHVPELLAVERHRNLLQMTSTVTGRTTASLSETLSSIFPPASVTGAPKISTCSLIARLEASPRHIYCGAIGIARPDRQRFSVAIRTALFQEKGQGEYGTGGGIVWDSEVAAEYEESLLKRDFLLQPGKPWRLVESIPAHRLREETYVDKHLQRLYNQANGFGIDVDLEPIREHLRAIPASDPTSRMRVRIELGIQGRFSISTASSAIGGSSIRAVLDRRSVCRHDPNFRIKSTSRAIFEERLVENPDFDEVLLFNEDGHLTEFCHGNLMLQMEGALFTPHPDSGCLPGIAVSEYVESNRVAYRDLTVADLAIAEQVFFINSTTGMLPAEIVRQTV